jgi:hypothetical protein
MRPETVADRLERFCAEAGRRNLVTGLLRATDHELLRSIRTMTDEGRGKLRQSQPLIRGSPADKVVVQFKHHVRLSFDDPDSKGRFITAKIGLPSEKGNGSLSREIKARKWLRRLSPQLPTPSS